MSLQVNIQDPRNWHGEPSADWLTYYGASSGFRAITLQFDGTSTAAIYLHSSESARELAALFTRAAVDLAVEEGITAAKRAAREAVTERAADADAVPTVDDLLALLR